MIADKSGNLKEEEEKIAEKISLIKKKV